MKKGREEKDREISSLKGSGEEKKTNVVGIKIGGENTHVTTQVSFYLPSQPQEVLNPLRGGTTRTRQRPRNL